MPEKTTVMELEPITKIQVASLQRFLGMGAMLIDWDIDYAIGRGVLDGLDRCLWSKDGRRITVIVGRDGFVMASQSDDPDPEYFQLKELKPNE